MCDFPVWNCYQLSLHHISIFKNKWVCPVGLLSRQALVANCNNAMQQMQLNGLSSVPRTLHGRKREPTAEGHPPTPTVCRGRRILKHNTHVSPAACPATSAHIPAHHVYVLLSRFYQKQKGHSQGTCCSSAPSTSSPSLKESLIFQRHYLIVSAYLDPNRLFIFSFSHLSI